MTDPFGSPDAPILSRDAPEPQAAPAEGPVQELAPHIYRIPIPTGFAVGNVNAYFVDGPDPALIDTGVHGEASLHVLSEALASIGRKVEDIRWILLTHSHVDHAANAQTIHEISGAPVKLMARGVRRFRDIEGSFRQEFPAFLAFMTRCGFSEKVVQEYGSMSESFLVLSRSCPDVEPMVDGEVLHVAGGRRLVAHHRPGHSSLDVVFALPDSDLLFLGDHVLPDITPNPTIEAPEPGDADRPRALVSYRRSLHGTRILRSRLACPGHGLPFPNLPDRCLEILDHQEKRIRRVLELVHRDGPVTIKDLGRTIFGRVRFWDLFLSVSEVYGAVQLLEAAGAVRIVDDSGVSRVVAVEGVDPVIP
jgi:glyoxylase-like metal-dependent hydrolase (beta-lactamase superfamily II)